MASERNVKINENWQDDKSLFVIEIPYFSKTYEQLFGQVDGQMHGQLYG